MTGAPNYNTGIKRGALGVVVPCPFEYFSPEPEAPTRYIGIWALVAAFEEPITTDTTPARAL